MNSLWRHLFLGATLAFCVFVGNLITRSTRFTCFCTGRTSKLQQKLVHNFVHNFAKFAVLVALLVKSVFCVCRFWWNVFGINFHENFKKIINSKYCWIKMLKISRIHVKFVKIFPSFMIFVRKSRYGQIWPLLPSWVDRAEKYSSGKPGGQAGYRDPERWEYCCDEYLGQSARRRNCHVFLVSLFKDIPG